MVSIGYFPINFYDRIITIHTNKIKKIASGTSMSDSESSKAGNYGPVSITLHLDAEANKELSEAAIRSSRTKRDEAYLRLTDHLQNFKAVGCKGFRLPSKQNRDN